MKKNILKMFAFLAMTSIAVSACSNNKNDDELSAALAELESIKNSISAEQALNSALNELESIKNSLSAEAEKNNSSSQGSQSSESSQASQNSQSSESSQASASSQTSESSSSSEQQEKYRVIVMSNSNATVTVSDQEAVKGTEITFSVNVASGYKLDKVTVNDKEVTGSKFTMPADTAIIQVYVSLLDKNGIILDGDISAKLVEENGIYVARNISVDTESYVKYVVNGTELSCTLIDNSRCFGDLSLSSQRNGFNVGGNATYDFYYDPSNADTPCYVIRTKVNSLPTSTAMYGSLWSGSVKSTSTVYPQNVNSVTFTSNTDNYKYEWNKYSNNSSLATISDAAGSIQTGLVYKAQTGNTYTVVNTFVDPISSSARDKRSKIDDLDSVAFSGKFDVVSAITSGNRKYQYTQEQVDEDANRYSFDMQDLDYFMYEAYRNGYVGNIFNDVDVFSDTTINSEYVGSNGDFKVTISTWIKWENSSTYDGSAYLTYDVVATFNAAGALLNGSYKYYEYDEKTYDFASNKLTAAASSVKATQDVTFAYTYGDAKAGQPTTDVSKYFVSEISNINVKGKNSDAGSIGISEQISCSDAATAEDSTGYNMTYTYAPTTALDTWQYGPEKSSNQSAISKKSSNDPYTFTGVGAGTSTITIGNHTSSGVKATVDVNVNAAAFLRQIFMYTIYPYNQNGDSVTASSAYLQCGSKYDIQLAGSSIHNVYQYDHLSVTFEYDNKDNTVKITYDEATGKMYIDLRDASVTEQKSINVKIVSPYILESWGGSSSFTLYLLPGETHPDTLVGTSWKDEENKYGDTMSFADTEVTLSLKDSATCVLTYTYDADNGKITAKMKSVNGKEVSSSDYIVYYAWDGSALGICIVELSYDYENYKTDYEALVGDISQDDDGYIEVTGYYFFTQSK